MHFGDYNYNTPPPILNPTITKETKNFATSHTALISIYNT